MSVEHDDGSARNHDDELLDRDPTSIRGWARKLGVSHTEVWRWMLAAEIPEAEFEALLDRFQKAGRPITTRAVADYARRRRGDWIPEDIQHCPHCGEPIRRRA